MVAELVLAVVATVDNCIRLGRQTLETYRAYRDTDESLDEKIVIIEGLWAKLETQLTFLSKVSDHLDDRLAESQINLLEKLHGRLVRVTAQIDLPESKYVRKLKHAMVKNKLDELVVDMETWQRRFDPTWFIITLIGNSVIDTELWERKREEAAGLFDSSPLHNMLALRQAIRPPNAEAAPPPGQLNMSINLEASGLADANIVSIPFSSARKITRRKAPKILIAENIEFPSGDVAQGKRLAENLARRLKYVDPDITGLLRCYGILKHRNESQHITSMDMVYLAPLPKGQPPMSLRELLLKQNPISASAIVRIAKQLVQSVSYVHSCDFVHKNIRPESIMVFPAEKESANGWSFGSSYLIGFNQFRDTCFQTNLKGDPRWHLNLYRHPQRQGTLVENRYIMQHDIYSLGVCLLEIGLWKSFVWYPANHSSDPVPVPGLTLGLAVSDDDFATIASASKIQTKEHFVELARRELPPRLGDMYTDLVVACLTCLDPGNTTFGSEDELCDGDGILIGVRFIEHILLRMADISI